MSQELTHRLLTLVAERNETIEMSQIHQCLYIIVKRTMGNSRGRCMRFGATQFLLCNVFIGDGLNIQLYQ